MKSIFEIENRLDINSEFEKLVRIFHEDNDAALYAEDKNHMRQYTTFIEAIDNMIFLKWKYRDTFIDVDEYLEHIGIDYERTLLYGIYQISEDSFLYYLEFLSNMVLLINTENTIELSRRVIAAIENISRILEKMNYKLKEVGDKVIIVKRDADVDSVLNNVPRNVADIILEYNDFRIRNDLNAKGKILKSIDLYLDKDNKKIKKQIRSIDNVLVDSFETILNNLGINHQNDNEIFKSISDDKKMEWYDKCFKMMLHGIRAIEVNQIKNERAELVKK